MTDISATVVDATGAAAALANDPGNSALSSSEQIYSPIFIVRSNNAAGHSISSFAQPLASSYSSGQYESGHVGPTRSELDPYFSNFLNSPSEWMKSNDFQMMSNNGASIQNGGADANIRKVNRGAVTQVAVNHFRGPLCISGWGTDLADRPVPSVSSSGELSWELDPSAVSSRATWPAGPVDLKWDEERSVWSGGHHLLCGWTKEVPKGEICAPSSFTMHVLRLKNGIGGGLDSAFRGETVTVLNHDPSLKEDAEDGKKIFVIAGRINYEWVPLWVGCPECDKGECKIEPCAA